ncbi:hypothetical protein AU252_01115 [Pseudarthrobacter sulfonivorans]|uniref:Uncharacterized protein n=1 Tax=Pseudarthrobacter sulfonivorans TaxID=121292 RepID=A0A0U3PZZ4_9MICC|nr:hypothetical protein [Pseudarthrobacter sulfonivorans]ALV39934.1 hypothetical protein AU252_01115 [Pseudarthrobacter sulfonivorans]
MLDDGGNEDSASVLEDAAAPPFGFLGSPLDVAFASSRVGSTELLEVIRLAEQGHREVHTETVSMDEVIATYARLATGDVIGRAEMVPWQAGAALKPNFAGCMSATSSTGGTGPCKTGLQPGGWRFLPSFDIA